MEKSNGVSSSLSTQNISDLFRPRILIMAFTRLKYLLGLFPFLFVTASIGESYQKGNSSEVHFDYVILGGGTAGLVIASRLSKNSNVTVVVIEAGDFEKTNPNVTSSTGLGLAKDTRVDWQYKSNTGLFGGNQSLVWSAGKGLGGSSLINGKAFNFYPSRCASDQYLQD